MLRIPLKDVVFINAIIRVRFRSMPTSGGDHYSGFQLGVKDCSVTFYFFATMTNDAGVKDKCTKHSWP